MSSTGVNHIEALEWRQLMAAVVSLDLSSVIAGDYVGTLVPLDAASRQALGAAGGASSGQGVGVGVVSKQDTAFLQRVESEQLKEIALGQVAQANAAGQEVRDFGAKMAADHTAVLAQVRALAASVGAALGGTMSPADQASVTRLSKLLGIRFDRAYAQEMVQSHRADVGEFLAERQRTGNAAVESFVIQTLPTLQSHLTAAEGLLAVAKGENRSNTIDLATPRAAIAAAGASVSATITGAAATGGIGGSLTIPNVASYTLFGTLAGRRLTLNLLSGGQTTGVIDASVLGTARRIAGRLDDIVSGTVVHARLSLTNTAALAKKGNGGSGGGNGATEGTGNTLLGNGTASTAGSNTGSNVGNTIGFGNGSAVSTGSGTAGSGTDSLFGTGTTDVFGSTGSSVFT